MNPSETIASPSFSLINILHPPNHRHRYKHRPLAQRNMKMADQYGDEDSMDSDDRGLLLCSAFGILDTWATIGSLAKADWQTLPPGLGEFLAAFFLVFYVVGVCTLLGFVCGHFSLDRSTTIFAASIAGFFVTVCYCILWSAEGGVCMAIFYIMGGTHVAAALEMKTAFLVGMVRGYGGSQD